MRSSETVAGLPRLRLFDGSTPLDDAPRLSRNLGVHLFVKRDDLFGPGGGGNKARKLEFIVGQALQEGVTALITTGGLQSNHARLTAAVAARCGMKAYLRLRGEVPERWQGNLVLDQLFGADVAFVGVKPYDVIHAEMVEFAKELAGKGEVPMVVPLGGAMPVGTLSYMLAFQELLAQCLMRHMLPDVVVVAAGTGCTYAGLLLGARFYSPRTRVLGISVSWSRDLLIKEVRRLVAEALDLLHQDLVINPDDIWIDDSYIGPGYNQPSADGLEALRCVARAEGLLLDTTYTGKATAGLFDQLQRGAISSGSTVIFVHTGGIPELFTRSLADLCLEGGSGPSGPMECKPS